MSATGNPYQPPAARVADAAQPDLRDDMLRPAGVTLAVRLLWAMMLIEFVTNAVSLDRWVDYALRGAAAARRLHPAVPATGKRMVPEPPRLNRREFPRAVIFPE
jgi:hypothetical protein